MPLTATDLMSQVLQVFKEWLFKVSLFYFNTNIFVKPIGTDFQYQLLEFQYHEITISASTFHLSSFQNDFGIVIFLLTCYILTLAKILFSVQIFLIIENIFVLGFMFMEVDVKRLKEHFFMKQY